MTAMDSLHGSHRVERNASHDQFRPTNHLTESAYGRPGDTSAFHHRNPVEPMGQLHMPPMPYPQSEHGAHRQGWAPHQNSAFTAHQILHGHVTETGQRTDRQGHHLTFPPLFGAHQHQHQHEHQSEHGQYQVKHGDNLWKIAAQSLHGSGVGHPSSQQIWHQVESIIAANKERHPGLHSNPNHITPDMQLSIPHPGQYQEHTHNQHHQHHQHHHHQHQHNSGAPQESPPGHHRPHSSNPQNFTRPNEQHSTQDQQPNDRPTRVPQEQAPAPNDRSQPPEKPPSEKQPQPDQNNGELSDMSKRLINSAIRVAHAMGSVGWCARGVQRALSGAGHSEFVGSGNAWDMRHAFDNSGQFQRVPLSEARPGDIVVRRRSGDYGHIATIVGQNRGGLVEASDHIAQFQANNPRYDYTLVYRPVGN